MKMTVISAGLGAPHAGWAAVDELAHLLAHYYGADLLAPAPQADSWWRRSAGRARPRFAPLPPAEGDVLFVVARGPEDLAVIDSLPGARKRFARVQAFITDSYHQAGFVEATRQYDAITVTAAEDAAWPARRFGVAAHQVRQGIDGLRWAPRRRRPRDIDLLAFGRTPPSYHASLQRRFHADSSPHLYLHSPLGNLAGPTVHMERGMLYKLLHRTRVSLAFHLLVEPQGQRPRSMMVTSRWLESLLAGCVVAGRRPQSAMAEDMLGWPGATLELPPDPEAAADAVQALLNLHEGLEMQRSRNVAETLARHDWRHRIAQMARLFGWGLPGGLTADLERVQSEADHWHHLARA